MRLQSAPATALWTPLLDELDRWESAGRHAPFWLRDDDAVEPTPALVRLLDICGRHEVPVALAVIPSRTGEELARLLDYRPLASVAVHGWSHRNHAGQGEKKQELGPQRPVETVAAELAEGLERLRILHGRRATALLVPPWNRISEPLVKQLPRLGYAALSVFGAEKPAPLKTINTHVDLMDWRGTRGARDANALIGDIVQRLREMFESGGAMGFLTHHLVHDEPGWEFVETLLTVTKGHSACRWVSVPDLLQDA